MQTASLQECTSVDMKNLLIGLVVGSVISFSVQVHADWDMLDYDLLKEIVGTYKTHVKLIEQQNKILERQAKALEHTQKAENCFPPYINQ